MLAACWKMAAAALLATITALPAWAQATQTEEQARRAAVLRGLPDWAAKRQFGTQASAAPMAARSIGSYAKGCLAGGTALAVDGGAWQVMRLSRNRMWGHPELIRFLEGFAKRVPGEAGWPGLLVGDISQPRGGPMLTGHASHQIGLDADIWLTPMPQRRLSQSERENMSATNMVRSDWMDVDTSVWTPNHTRVIRMAARDSKVHRIFVNPAIKKALCREAGNGPRLAAHRPADVGPQLPLPHPHGLSGGHGRLRGAGRAARGRRLRGGARPLAGAAAQGDVRAQGAAGPEGSRPRRRCQSTPLPPMCPRGAGGALDGRRAAARQDP